MRHIAAALENPPRQPLKRSLPRTRASLPALVVACGVPDVLGIALRLAPVARDAQDTDRDAVHAEGEYTRDVVRVASEDVKEHLSRELARVARRREGGRPAEGACAVQLAARRGVIQRT